MSEQLRVAGLQGRGRPRKGSLAVTLADLGFTRQEVYEFRKLAEIPHEDFEAYIRTPGKHTRRGILVHFKKRNVVSDDIFVDTPVGDLAEALLAGIWRILPEMTEKQRRYFFRALHARLRTLARKAELELP